MSAKADKTGSCSFCGQTKIIQVPEEWEQGQINEAVTCECECEQAQAYAKAKERKDKAKKRVNELFGSGAEKPVAEDVVNLLIATVDAIEDKHMKGITVDVGHGVKAKVSKKVLRLSGQRIKRPPTKNSGFGGGSIAKN